MNIDFLSIAFVHTWVGLTLLLVGAGLVWHGLVGGRDGTSGLLNGRAFAIRRMEGFRRLVLGLVVFGLGAAWVWQSPTFFYLAIGIGFVELVESSAVIATMKAARLKR